MKLKDDKNCKKYKIILGNSGPSLVYVLNTLTFDYIKGDMSDLLISYLSARSIY